MKNTLVPSLVLFTLSSACAFTPYTGGATSRSPAARLACEGRALDVAATERVAAPHVVLVRSELGLGTGFVLDTGDPSTLTVITNHHVIEGGRRFELDVLGAPGKAVTLANVEVVRVDAARDLAILRTANPSGRVSGLALARSSPVVGTSMVVLGYPWVGGSKPTMTVERGEITAPDRELGGARYIQTNANVNRGNSGGPAIDACGRVLGVVVATSRTTERTSLVIPAASVQELLEKDRARHPPKVLAAATVEVFFEALTFGRSANVSGLLSRAYLDQRILPAWNASIQSTIGRIGAVRASLAGSGVVLEQLPKERIERVLAGTLAREELLTAALMAELEEKELTSERAVRAYFALVLAPNVFGKVTSHRVERVDVDGADARALVTVEGERGRERWTVHLRHEWGAWSLAGFDRV